MKGEKNNIIVCLIFLIFKFGFEKLLMLFCSAELKCSMMLGV